MKIFYVEQRKKEERKESKEEGTFKLHYRFAFKYFGDFETITYLPEILFSAHRNLTTENGAVFEMSLGYLNKKLLINYLAQCLKIVTIQ